MLILLPLPGAGLLAVVLWAIAQIFPPPLSEIAMVIAF